MKQVLLTGLFSLTAVGMALATPVSQDFEVMKMAGKTTVKSVKNSVGVNGRQLAPGVKVTNAGGVKKLHTPNSLNRELPTVRTNAPRKAGSVAPEGYVLFESFEGWDGEDPEWTPDGWTVEMRGDVERGESWGPSAANIMLPLPSDGNYYYGINFSEGQQDEWLISPMVPVEENMSLSYWLFLDPAFLFSLDNVDWDEYEFVGDKVVAATLQIWAQPEGGEWTMLHDYVDDYKDMSLMDMLMLSPTSLEKRSQSLDEFAGKNVKVAFRYVGTDGNTMLIDAIGIGYPALEDVTYMDPFSTLYWGFERDWKLSGLTAAIAQYPVYAPLTWTNMAYIEDATFSWEYCDPITAEMVTSDDYDLTVTYVPDYSSESTMKNNLFYPPTLHATAPNATPASYTAPYVYFQAGGKAERTLNDGSEFSASLLSYSYHDLGLTMITVDDPEIGDGAIPVFGYNSNTDRYWLNYSLNGEEPMEGDYSKLEAIGNIFFATEAPLVVNGMTVYGFGQIDDDAELTATIYALNEEMSTDFSTFTEIASTSIKGSDILAEYKDSKGYMALPFNFDTPVVVKGSMEHPVFAFMFSGFNSEKVDYFAPFQSELPDPNYLCLGYMLNHIDVSNHVDRPAYYSFKPMVYKENGDYVDPYGAFAIGIEAEYPWLTTDCKEIELTRDGGKVEVALGSYYDGSLLTVTAPAGVTASVAGRYNKCILTVEHDDSEVIVDGDIVVSGPGVEVSIPVKEVGTGISSIAKDGADVVGIYNLNGNRVESPENGIYVVRYSDGSVRKIVVR